MPAANRTETPAADSAPAHPIQYAEEGQAPDAAPTRDDYAAEWGTWTAAVALSVDGIPAVAKGAPVPASHPLVLDGTWTVDNGCLVDAQKAEADRLAAEEAARKK